MLTRAGPGSAKKNGELHSAAITTLTCTPIAAITSHHQHKHENVIDLIDVYTYDHLYAMCSPKFKKIVACHHDLSINYKGTAW